MHFLQPVHKSVSILSIAIIMTIPFVVLQHKINNAIHRGICKGIFLHMVWTNQGATLPEPAL